MLFLVLLAVAAAEPTCDKDTMLKALDEADEALNRLLASMNPLFVNYNPDSERYPAIAARYCSDLLKEYDQHIENVLTGVIVDAPDCGKTYIPNLWKDSNYNYGFSRLLTNDLFVNGSYYVPFDQLYIDVPFGHQPKKARTEYTQCEITLPRNLFYKIARHPDFTCPGGQPATTMYYCHAYGTIITCQAETCRIMYAHRRPMALDYLECSVLTLCNSTEQYDDKAEKTIPVAIDAFLVPQAEHECTREEYSAKVVYTVLNNPLTRQELFDLQYQHGTKIYVRANDGMGLMHTFPKLAKYMPVNVLLDAGISEDTVNEFFNFYRVAVFHKDMEKLVAVAQTETQRKMEAKFGPV